MNSIEAVIINWKRPKNVAQIVAALRSQTEPCTVTVCDCHPSPEFALGEDTLSLVDRLYRWSRNLGSYNRFVPMGAYDHRYTLFLDDDMLPGLRCAEHFLRSAMQIESFGVLGQLGRIIQPDGVYRYANVPRTGGFVETDVIIRGYFVRTENLAYLLQFRRMMDFDELISTDDLLLCTSLRTLAGLSCYLTPWEPDDEALMNKRELSDDYALSIRPEHLERRQEFLRRAGRAGWVSLHLRGLTR
jgi:GT2 family glycosyltransferase